MISVGRRRRSGLALVFALLALLVFTMVAVSLFATAMHTDLSARLDSAEHQAEVLGRDARPLALAWLSEHASMYPSVLLGQDGRFEIDPRGYVPVLEDEHDGVFVRVRVIDLAGRLHVRHHGPSVRALGVISGASTPLGGTAVLTAESHRPPQPVDAVATEHSLSTWPELGVGSVDLSSIGPRSASELLTSHGRRAVNLRTAPREVLDAVLVGLDPVVSSRVLDAASAGRALDAADIHRLVSQRDRIRQASPKNTDAPLTAIAGPFGVLIEVQVTSTWQSWWGVADRVARPDLGDRTLKWRYVRWSRAERSR